MAADPEMMAQLERALEHAADAVGDIVPPAIALFYTRFPDALASFEHHALVDQRARLEREMVDNALYCLMIWPMRKSEIQGLLYSSIPHHHHTLHVSAMWYQGLIDAVTDVIASSLPDDFGVERTTLNTIRSGIGSAIAAAMV